MRRRLRWQAGCAFDGRGACIKHKQGVARPAPSPLQPPRVAATLNGHSTWAHLRCRERGKERVLLLWCMKETATYA